MIGQTPEKIALEIEAGVRERDRKLAIFKDQIDGYATFLDHDRLDESGRIYNPENHVYEYISFVVPQLAYSNPRVSLKSRVYGTERDMALMRYFVNTWSQDNSYGELMTAPAHDICFNFCAALTRVEDHAYLKLDDGNPAKTVKVYRLSQRHYIRDPGALTKDDARWEAHEWHMDKEDLVRLAESDPEGGWDLEVIRGLPTADDADDKKRKTKIPDRKQIRCYDFWIKDAVLEDAETEGTTRENGFHGVIFTLAAYKGDDGALMDFIREPRAFYGPPEGMYDFGWVHYVPDEPYGLSSLVAVEGQIRDLNLHARTMSRRAANRKRPIIVDEMAEGALAEKLQEAKDDEVFGVAGFDSSRIWSGEIGGITDQDLSYSQISRERLERVSGLSEQQRGIAGNADSATEAAIAKEGGDIRLEYTKLQFQRFARGPLRKVAWYFHQDDRMRHVLPPEAGMELGIPVLPGDFLIVAGGNPTIPFDQLAIEIEPLSMERTTTSSNQRRASELFELIVNMAQMIPTMPYVNWGELMDQLGDAYNVPRMGELIDLQMASMMAMVPMAPGQTNPGAVLAPNAQPAPAQGSGKRPSATPALGILSNSPFSGFKQGQKASNAPRGM